MKYITKLKSVSVSSKTDNKTISMKRKIAKKRKHDKNEIV